MPEEIKKCVVCGQTLKFVPAGVSRTTGKSYQQFWACPDRHRQPNTGQSMVMDELGRINERLDKLAKFLHDKFQ